MRASRKEMLIQSIWRKCDLLTVNSYINTNLRSLEWEEVNYKKNQQYLKYG